MIFQKHNRILLSARKCGLMTLSNVVTAEWTNLSGSTKYQYGNPDPTSPMRPRNVWLPYYKGHSSGNCIDRMSYPYGDTAISMPWDNSFWKEKDITLVIRDPIERYASGIAQLFKLLGDPIKGHNVDVTTFPTWWANLDKSNLSFDDGHTANWLYLIKDMEYNSMQIVKTDELNNWLESEGLVPKRINQTPPAMKSQVEQVMSDKSILEYLKPEVEMYNYLLDKHYKE
tara:strand:+ start:1877 stop:2560 length:684 start_codon:yes stop_codon:yes gene_type:complete